MAVTTKEMILITPSFSLLPDFAMQYGVVQYGDSTFGICNVSHFNPPGNSDPNIPFTGITISTDPGSPSQEGAELAWATKANNMLGKTFATSAEAIEQLHEVLGGMANLGLDQFNPANNPFQSQFTKSDFPDGQTDQMHF
jgi:hypothetical protein